MDLALNSLQWLKGHKTKQNQINAQSAGAVEYTDCTSERIKSPPPQQVSWI